MFTLLNVQGLIGRRYNKLNSKEFKKMFVSSDIIMFTEAWSDDCYDYHVDGYNYYILHRTIKHRRAQRDSRGGGRYSLKINLASVIFSFQEILTHELEIGQILLKMSFCINLRCCQIIMSRIPFRAEVHKIRS